MKDTMKIERGQWTLDGNAIWQFTPEEDITGQLAVQYGPDDRNFRCILAILGLMNIVSPIKPKSIIFPKR